MTLQQVRYIPTLVIFKYKKNTLYWSWVMSLRACHVNTNMLVFVIRPENRTDMGIATLAKQAPEEQNLCM